LTRSRPRPRHAGDERCAALQGLNQAFIDAQAADPYDVSAVMAADKAFHSALAEASGSRLLATLLGEVGDQIDDSRRILLADRGRAQSSAREHQLVVDAILAHDPPAARSAAGFHIDRVCAFVAELVEGRGRGGSDTRG
jgi:GntR family transcriptional regulator, transcriptional repressor for pyruvate dehydrogenase complex